MSPLARVLEHDVGEVAIVRVEGEVDASNAAEIGARLRQPLSNRSMALIVDLSATTYLDSAGINTLFELADDLGRRQQRLQLVLDPASPIARMVEIAGLAAVVPTHETEAAALERLGMQRSWETPEKVPRPG